MDRKFFLCLASWDQAFRTLCCINLRHVTKSFLLALLTVSLIYQPALAWVRLSNIRPPAKPGKTTSGKAAMPLPAKAVKTMVTAPPAAPPFFAPLNSTTIYTSYGAGTATAKNLGTLNTTTGANTALFTTSAMGYTAGLGYNPTDNQLYYADRNVGPNALRRYNGTTESAAFATFTGTSIGTGAIPIIRMAFAGATGYAISTANLYQFTSANTGAIAISSAISFVGTSPSGSTASGDMAFDLAGHAWAIFGNSLYRMDLSVSPVKAHPIAQISVGGVPLATGSWTVSGAAFDTSDTLYISAVTPTNAPTSTNIYKVNVSNATATLVGSPATVISDLASGVTPDLNPVISAIKTVSPTTNAKPGDTLTYTIEIENTGNAPAVNSTFTDAEPTGTTYVPNSATLNGTNLNANSYPFSTAYTINGRNASAGSIMVGNANRATITYQVTVNTTSPPTSVSNIGNIKYLDGPASGVDTKPSTTTTGPTITTIDSPVLGYKSVKLTTDADSSSSITPGDTLTWTLSYKNSSALSISNFQINDQLPPGVTISSTGEQTVTVSGVGTAATKNITYTGAAAGAASHLLTSGATLGDAGIITVSIPVTVNTGFAGIINNQSAATGSAIPGTTGTLSDNVDSTTTGLPSGVTVPAGSVAQTQGTGIDSTTATVANQAKITLAKSVLPIGEQIPGTDLTYQITYTNIGNFAAQLFTLIDPIPTSTDFKLGSVTTNPPTGITITIEYSNDYDVNNPGIATWTFTPGSSGTGGAPAGYDRNVKAIRWYATAGNVSQTPPDNIGNVGFTVIIR